MTEKFEIVDEAPVVYFTMVPNMVFGLPIHKDAKYLYMYLRRVAGEHGKCWQSIATLVEGTGIGENSIRKYKKQLLEIGLIKIQEGDRSRSETDTITLVNIWQKNYETFTGKNGTTQDADPTHEIVSTLVTESSPAWVQNREGKNNTIKKNPVKKINIVASPPGENDPIIEEPEYIDIEENKPKAKGISMYQVAQLISEVTLVDINIPSQKARLLKVAKEIKAVEESPNFELFSRWWHRYDWRGKQGQKPTPEQIPQVWGAFQTALEKRKSTVTPSDRRKKAMSELMV